MNVIDNSLAQSADSQAQITPALALEILKDGNDRFQENRFLSRNYNSQIKATSTGQYPFAVVLSCIDSRVPTELIFDQGIGDIFNACIAGNFVNEDILGSMEFACKLAGVKLIVVMGHTSCGAVKGACDGAQLGNLTQMLNKIKPAVDSTSSAEGEDRSSGNIGFVNRVASRNVEMTISNIREHSPVINDMLTSGEVAIVGAMYDVASGEVHFFDN